jgi:hypothetical protein
MGGNGWYFTEGSLSIGMVGRWNYGEQVAELENDRPCARDV